MATTTYKNQSVFSVISNSTIAKLTFDSARKKLSFSVTVPTNLTGYINAYVDNSLIENASDLKVFLDGIKAPYSTQLQGDSRLVSFTYVNSTSEVVIDLGYSTTKGVLEIPFWLALIIGAILLIVALAILITAFGKIGESTNPFKNT